ncbi:hypothetical protein [Rhizobium terrae]|uniref:hypothetical protein n=1 Tax=Rhizobium terrae TaxID=2171756 RepID=UPI0013C3352B|nr:hypothetical protein [Rhizobium terrae]
MGNDEQPNPMDKFIFSVQIARLFFCNRTVNLAADVQRKAQEDLSELMVQANIGLLAPLNSHYHGTQLQADVKSHFDKINGQLDTHVGIGESAANREAILYRLTDILVEESRTGAHLSGKECAEILNRPLPRSRLPQEIRQARTAKLTLGQSISAGDALQMREAFLLYNIETWNRALDSLSVFSSRYRFRDDIDQHGVGVQGELYFSEQMINKQLWNSLSKTYPVLFSVSKILEKDHIGRSSRRLKAGLAPSRFEARIPWASPPEIPSSPAISLRSSPPVINDMRSRKATPESEVDENAVPPSRLRRLDNSNRSGNEGITIRQDGSAEMPSPALPELNSPTAFRRSRAEYEGNTAEDHAPTVRRRRLKSPGRSEKGEFAIHEDPAAEAPSSGSLNTGSARRSADGSSRRTPRGPQSDPMPPFGKERRRRNLSIHSFPVHVDPPEAYVEALMATCGPAETPSATSNKENTPPGPNPNRQFVRTPREGPTR